MKLSISNMFSAIVIIKLSFASIWASSYEKLTAVEGFELERYLGTWYEIARMPNWFERNLVNVTATYSLDGKARVKVLNQGYKNSKDGKLSKAIGKAKIAFREDIGHLKVSFFGPFYSDYIIVELDQENYQWAMVASSFKYLWILSRTPTIDRTILDKLISKASSMGFDATKLYIVPQQW